MLMQRVIKIYSPEMIVAFVVAAHEIGDTPSYFYWRGWEAVVCENPTILRLSGPTKEMYELGMADAKGEMNV